MKRSTFYLLIFGGVALRFLAWWLLPSTLADDSACYHEIALNLLNQGRFLGSEGIAYRPPLQPFFIFFIYKIFGPKTFFVSLCQVFLSLVTAILLWRVVSIIFNQKVGTIAFVLSLFSFDLSLFAPLIMSETILFFLLTLGFWGLFHFESSFRKTWPLLMAGLSWGLSVLAKPIVFPVFLLFSVFLRKEKILTQNKLFLSFLFLLVFLSATWSIRNTIIFRQPVFISTNGGLNFYIGNNPYSRGTYDKDTEKILSMFTDKTELKRNNLFFKEGIKFVLSHPGRTLINLLRKPFYLLATFGGSAEGLIIREAKREGSELKNIIRAFFGGGQLIGYWLILLGAIYFLITKFRKLRDNFELKSLLFFAAGYFLCLLPFFTFPRFRIPLLLPLIVFASSGIKMFLSRPNFKRLTWTLAIFILLTSRDWYKIMAFLIGKMYAIIKLI